MAEIYWLQRIGALSDLFSFTWIIATIVFVVAIVISFIATIEEEDGDGDGSVEKAKTYTKISFIAIVIGAFGDILTPSTKEMYAIYGIGGTIEYIKSNDKAKQLPDKCIDALTRYVDSIEKENKDNNNN